MTHKTFSNSIEAYALRYDLKQQKVKSYWSVDVNGGYTVTYYSKL